MSSPHGREVSSADHSTTWKKVLWERQPNFPDNYTDYDNTFLEELIVNRNYTPKKYFAAVCESLSITRQMSVVAVCVCAYDLLHTNKVSATSLAVINTLLLCSLLATRRGRRACSRLLLTSVHAPFFWLLWFCMWPTFRPLGVMLTGKGYKDVTAVLLGIHFGMHEYGARHVLNRTVRRRLAIASVLSAMGTLALQLPSHALALQLEVLALLLLVVFPEAALLTKVVSRVDLCLALLLIASSLGLVLHNSILLGALLACIYIFVSLYCPGWLIRLQNYKRTINGPWDEAKPKTKQAPASTMHEDH
mmetsp:Transcript_9797/g.35903  ORF Transcript_9797/g.35903 Transcript_9797/m.35903 type:complete len:305 (-) Transcript_9797:59-973(-)